MPESPDIPEDITTKIRSVMPHSLPSQEQPLPGQQADPDRNEPMPYLRPEGLLPVNGEREFDVSVLDHAGPTVKVMAGTWMGIRQTGATFDGSRRAYHALTVANGDKIYLKLDYHELISGGTLTILAGALPSDDPANGIFYQQLASVSIAAGIISISQTRWGPFGYAGRLQHLREFDVSVLSDAGPSVTVMGGSWMGIKGSGGFYGPSRNEAFFLYVANGDTVYVKLDRGAGTLTYHAGATVPGNSPELGLYYTALATVSIAAGRITVAQTRWGPLEYLPGEHREFHIEPSGAYYVKIYNGTLFGSMPAGFSVNDSPIFTLAVANNDKIYAKVTWDRRVLATGDIVNTISGRTIAAAAAVPADNNLTATRHYQLATVTLGAGNIPVVSQSRWGPIDDLPGTAYYNYIMPPLGSETTAQIDYWDLLVTGKGKDTAAADLAPTYDSVQTINSGLSRFVKTGDNLKIFVREITVNSIGQITYIGDEALVFDQNVVNP